MGRHPRRARGQQRCSISPSCTGFPGIRSLLARPISKHASTGARVGGVSGRPARVLRRSDPLFRALAAGGERHPGSFGERRPSRGGAGRRVLSGLLFASPQLQWRRVESMARDHRVSGACQGGEPLSAIAMRWQPVRPQTPHAVTGPSLGAPTFASFAGLAWPSRWYRARQVFSHSHR